MEERLTTNIHQSRAAVASAEMENSSIQTYSVSDYCCSMEAAAPALSQNGIETPSVFPVTHFPLHFPFTMADELPASNLAFHSSWLALREQQPRTNSAGGTALRREGKSQDGKVSPPSQGDQLCRCPGFRTLECQSGGWLCHTAASTLLAVNLSAVIPLVLF